MKPVLPAIRSERRLLLESQLNDTPIEKKLGVLNFLNQLDSFMIPLAL